MPQLNSIKTKRYFNYLLLLIFAFSILYCRSERYNQGSTNETFNDLKKNFKNPASNYGVNCWWWWLNGNVNKSAITRDLEAMKSRNFQGTQRQATENYGQNLRRELKVLKRYDDKMTFWITATSTEAPLGGNPFTAEPQPIYC